MIESILQTFLFLATFDTILISVSIANYAISASYLGRETRLTRRRMEKRNQELDVRLKELQNKGLSIKDLEVETKKAKDDMNTLKNRLFFLSWIGAVLVPSLFFVVSLVFSVLGINSDILFTDLGIAWHDFLVRDLLLYSVISLGLGFSFLMLVIFIIDSAARRIPIPEFEVYFKNLLKTLKCKRKQTLFITLCIKNKGEDFAEDALVMVHFPSTFQLQPMDYRTFEQGPETDHPDYKSAIFDIKRSYPDTVLYTDISMTTPDDTEIHEIFVSIYETKSGHSKYKLTIQTTD